MRSYELMMILRPELEEEAIDETIAKATSIITNYGGEVANIDKWGKKRLAFEIKGNTEGFYVVIDFDAENEATLEVNRVLKITNEILRFLLVRKDKE